jgi:hypothetical protein
MRHLVIPGGTFCEAFPNGTHVEALHKDMLWLRCAPDGRFAWQDQPTGHIWEMVPGQFAQDRGVSFGINPVIYAPDLVINTGQVTGQGFRFWDGSRIWTGDETVQGVDLAEWTQLGDVRVGFSYKGARILINGRVLYEGNAKAVRFNRDGNSLAIAFWSDAGSQFIWLDRAEVETLPREDEESPVPDPLADTDLDRRILKTLQEVRAKYPNPIKDKLFETLGAILNETAWIRRQAGDPVWLESRPGEDNSAIQPKTGTFLAKDIIQTVEDGKRMGRDFLDATGIGVARPYLGKKDTALDAKAVLPVNPGGVTPDPDPPPAGELEARVAALETRLKNIEQWAREIAF